ncbi:hypothetical protein D3C78_1441330 [compost metagenome]
MDGYRVDTRRCVGLHPDGSGRRFGRVGEESPQPGRGDVQPAGAVQLGPEDGTDRGGHAQCHQYPACAAVCLERRLEPHLPNHSSDYRPARPGPQWRGG